MDPKLKDMEGLPVPSSFTDENLNIMRTVPFRPNDIIQITYPKCGTNWIAYITWSMLHPDEPPPGGNRVMEDITFTDLHGLGPWSESPEDEGRTLATHLPYDKVKVNKTTRFIVMYRNPMDCCVSYYHFAKTLFRLKYAEVEGQEVPDPFFDDFVSGNISYGDFFKHVKSWYPHKDEPNIHLVLYEKLKEDPRGEILRLAKFLGRDEMVEADGGRLLDQILEQSSFGVMKKNVTYTNPMEKDSEMPVLRKGESGGYRKSLTEGQIKILKDKMEKELAGTELLEYWRNF